MLYSETMKRKSQITLLQCHRFAISLGSDKGSKNTKLSADFLSECNITLSFLGHVLVKLRSTESFDDRHSVWTSRSVHERSVSTEK